MPPVGFEPTIAAGERSQTYASDRAAIGIGNKPHLSIENKLPVYQAVIKPIRSYGIELWSWASKSNIVIMQRSQSKILRAVVNAPRYVTKSYST